PGPCAATRLTGAGGARSSSTPPPPRCVLLPAVAAFARGSPGPRAPRPWGRARPRGRSQGTRGRAPRHAAPPGDPNRGPLPLADESGLAGRGEHADRGDRAPPRPHPTAQPRARARRNRPRPRRLRPTRPGPGTHRRSPPAGVADRGGQGDIPVGNAAPGGGGGARRTAGPV